VHVGTALVAHLEPAEAVEPRERSLHHPAILPKALARFDAAPRDAGDDAARPQRLSAARVVIALVGMQLHRALAWASAPPVGQPQRWDRIDRLFQQLRIMHVGPREGHRQRHTMAVDHDMALRAQLAAIGWILASLLAPPGAGTLALSSDARSQSICPTSRSRCKST
jgi:hypothetical protein